MNHSRALASLALAVLLAASACGGPSAPTKSLHVTMTDFAFSPNSFSIPAGEEISFELTNNGAVTHTFIIMKAGRDVQAHFTDADMANVYWEAPHVPPGETVKGSFTAPEEAGAYQVVCGVGGHFEAGMIAKLNVVKGP